MASAAPSPSPSSTTSSLPSTISSAKARAKFAELLAPRAGRSSDFDIEERLKKLRRLILVHGIPDDQPPFRPLVWKLLLRVHSLQANAYLSLVAKGRSEVSDKIRNDTFRTLRSDQKFKARVGEDMLVRLLEAFAWRSLDSSTQYVQGMNVLAAPFLYTMPSEIEAFACFSKFIEKTCPLYVLPTLEGVHRGLKLLDRCLQIVDPKLFNHLRRHNLSAEIYAFPSVLTLSACTPPLAQVLQLWDFLLAFGPHMNILCVIAQVLLMREEIMSSPSPMRLLRTFPPLDAQPIIGIAVTLVRDLPEDVYDDLVRHPFDPRDQ